MSLLVACLAIVGAAVVVVLIWAGAWLAGMVCAVAVLWACGWVLRHSWR